MSKLNQPKRTQDDVINKLRGAIIHRGLWMGLILKEAKERGFDWELIGHSAVLKAGCIHGESIKERMDVPGSLVSFGNTFFTEDIKKVFEIEVKKINEEELELEYGYCPLVTAWQQIGIEGEMLATLCDIAMSGDRGIAGRFEEFEFHLGKTIAQGHRVCEVNFTRKKQIEK
ncbi:MAG: L-2-amino-thiazoline-4-carboxylic acid hydrolase [Deltaproteobacteria bacterium]|nr:L-2-amino-thiazoline-4-carboxylic acid hydrolase [Deltaproteobacteria bacterium]